MTSAPFPHEPALPLYLLRRNLPSLGLAGQLPASWSGLANLRRL